MALITFDESGLSADSTLSQTFNLFRDAIGNAPPGIEKALSDLLKDAVETQKILLALPDLDRQKAIQIAGLMFAQGAYEFARHFNLPEKNSLSAKVKAIFQGTGLSEENFQFEACSTTDDYSELTNEQQIMVACQLQYAADGYVNGTIIPGTQDLTKESAAVVLPRLAQSLNKDVVPASLYNRLTETIQKLQLSIG
jgi:hypothetical protein